MERVRTNRNRLKSDKTGIKAVMLTAAVFAVLLCGCATNSAASATESPQTEALVETSPDSTAKIAETPAPVVKEYTFAEGSGVTVEAIRKLLADTPSIETVILADPAFSVYDNAKELAILKSENEIAFTFKQEIGGETVTEASTEVALNMFPDDTETFKSFISLTDITTVRLDFAASVEELKTWSEALPDLSVAWQSELYGQAITSETESLDFNGVPIEDLSPFYAILPLMSNLHTLEMCGCGIGNEEMDALRTAFPEAGIVWSIKTEHWTVRTDATYFATWLIVGRDEEGCITEAYGINGNTNEDLDWLKYCHDMVALDVGHNVIQNIEFVRYMPKLEYLIIADNKVSDLTPVEGLTNLHYLEIFANSISDITPLANLKNLTDLNTCGCPIEDFSPLDELPLERLWITAYAVKEKPAVLEEKMAAIHPGCEFQIINDKGFTEKGWRNCDKYWDMRVALGRHDPRKDS